jgi:hypothetical protein
MTRYLTPPAVLLILVAAAPASARPTANFGINPEPAVRQSPTQFTFSGRCDRSPCTYRWFHGDASSTEEIATDLPQPRTTATFTYVGTPGPRTITLKVRNRRGQEASLTRTFSLVNPSTSPRPSSPPAPAPAKCANGLDDDGDGLVDMKDPGCTSNTDNDESNVVSAPSSGYADASNTGVPQGTTLTQSGGITVSTAGAVINGLDISGPVVVNAPNVTIRNSRIRTTSYWAVDNNSTGLLIEDTEIDGLNGYGNCFGSSYATIRRVDMHGCENGLNVAGKLTLEDSYIHGLTTGGSAHTDGAQFNQGATDIVFRHNTIVAGQGGGSTSCVIMWDAESPQNQRVWIENNRLICTGAAWGMYTPRQSGWSDIYVNNNRWRSGVFGYWNGQRPTQFNGNVDDATGQPVN